MTRNSIPAFARSVGESFRLEADEHGMNVTLVIVPMDARAIIPRDVFCRFASAVADVLGYLTETPSRAQRRSKQ